LADRWILSRYANCVKDVTRNLKTYRLSEAAQALYQFTWHEYCDWYLEMIKPRWQAAPDGPPLDARDALTARTVAWRVLDGVSHVLHPFMPSVTEEIGQALPHTADSLVHAAWPRAKKAWFDAAAETQVQFLQEVVVAIRNLRSEMNLPPARLVPAFVKASGE